MEKLMKEIHSCIPFMTSALGAVCSSIPFCYQELIRSRGLMRDRRQHTGILLLNIP